MAIIGQNVQAGLGRIDYTPYLQGASMGAQGIASGISSLGKSAAGAIDLYQKNKEEEKQASANIKTSETLIKGLKALADQKDTKGNPVLPKEIADSIDQLSVAITDPSIGVRERSAIARQGIQQFSGLINAGMSAAQLQSSLRDADAKANLTAVQAQALSSQLDQQKKDNQAIINALNSVSQDKDGKLSMENLVSGAIQSGISVEGLKALKGLLPTPRGRGTIERIDTTDEMGNPIKVTVETFDDGTRKVLGTVRTDIQPGMRATAGGGVEPIPGSKEDLARKQATEATQSLYQQGFAQGEEVLKAIAGAKSIVKDSPISVQGFGSTALGWTPIAATLDGFYNTIRGNTVLETIRKARSESPTGGNPFGQMNMKEFEAAASVKGSLDRGMTDKSVINNMDSIAKGIFAAYPELRQKYGFVIEGQARPPQLKVGSRFSGNQNP